jgi:subtilisin family serine protease
MPSWSDGEGGGQVHEALAQLLGSGQTARDLVFFASAGNTALRHWSGTFCPNEGGLHQWGAGRTTNLLKPWASERVAVELYGPTKVSCELQVWEEATGNLVGNMILQPDGAGLWGQAVVRFEPLPGRDYRVRLRCPAAIQGKEKFHVVALGGDLEEVSPGGSIAFPGDGVQVVAVGAVDRAGKRLSYSSCGPNSSRPKPDFVSAVPFPSFFRTRPFAGTSAAAPQAAALAALCYARNPEWTPNQLHAALESAALDLCTPGHDCETGYGLIRLP